MSSGLSCDVEEDDCSDAIADVPTRNGYAVPETFCSSGGRGCCNRKFGKCISSTNFGEGCPKAKFVISPWWPVPG